MSKLNKKSTTYKQTQTKEANTSQIKVKNFLESQMMREVILFAKLVRLNPAN